MVILCTVLAIYTVSLLTPLFWALLTSFKNEKVFTVANNAKDVKALLNLKYLCFDNYEFTFLNFKMPTRDNSEGVGLVYMFFNSFLYAGGCAIIQTMVTCVMAYLVARYDYKLGSVVYTIVLVAMAIPIVGSLPSEIKMVKNLGLMDSVLGLYVLKANFLGIYFLVFHAQFKVIPKDYTEAAEIDGASDFYIMTKVILPIAFGTISTVMLLNFIQYWNDYQIPMIYWEPRPVVAYGLYHIVSTTEFKKPPVQLGATMVVAVPIIVLFLIFNKKIMSNMSIGGVKG